MDDNAFVPASVADVATADALAVAAIRAGDRERFQELVERHADKVVAIAWSRLGDRDLAEEAAQVAFISAYRRLPFLSRAEKFGTWIAAIVRNAAINLGLRRRSELRKRRRWALDPTEAPSVDSGDDPTTTDTLRATLDELPPIHRECLVLFYLEKRSVADAATRLGISENTFKVRLHRARAVLRDSLESKLENGLDRLAASPRLVRAVMLGLPAQSSGWIAAGGLVPGIAKMLPFSAVLLLLQMLAIVPGLVFAYWLGRSDLENFREPASFRGTLYRRFLNGMLCFVGGWTLLMHVASAKVGLDTFATVMGVALGILGADQMRRLRLLRHPLHWASASGVLLVAIPLLGMGLLHWPLSVLLTCQGVFFLVMSWATPKAPMRMDYSLFTRAAHGLLRTVEPAKPPEPHEQARQRRPSTPRPIPGPTRTNAEGNQLPAVLSRRENHRFVRFLGERLLVEDWRERSGDIELRLARAVTRILATTVPWYWGPTSRAFLRRDGTVACRFGEADRLELSRTLPGSLPPTHDLESTVARALTRSRAAYLQGNLAEANQSLGEEPESSVFRISPARSRATRIRVWVLRVAAILLPCAGALQFIDHRIDGGSVLKPVRLDESEVRAFLADLAPGATNRAARSQFQFGAWAGEVMPPREWFTPETLGSVQSDLLGGLTTNASGGSPSNSPIVLAAGMPYFARAAGLGLFAPSDLEPVGLDPATSRATLAKLPPERRASLVVLDEFQVHESPHRILSTRELADRVRLLDRWACLDLFDLTPIVPRLLASQVLTRVPQAGRPPIPDLALVHGLFHTQSGEFLSDTRDTLYLLSKAGALDEIDRSACVQGILRLHRGKGLFAPKNRESAPLLRGQASDTWRALESLRLLNALDQVADLQAWEFRPDLGEWIVDSGTRARPWSSIEAWLLRREFELLRVSLSGSKKGDRDRASR